MNPKPPVITFSFEKYSRMGDRYMDNIKGIVDVIFDIHRVEEIYFNILQSNGDAMVAKETMNKNELIELLNKIEKAWKDEDEVEQCDRCGREDVSYCQSNKCLDHLA